VNSIVDSESSDGKVWPEDEDKPKSQWSDYKMEDTEELDEAVSKKQLNRRVSTFDHANCINRNPLVACRPSKTLAATLMSIGTTMTTQCCAM
jgi:hypothetical protein